jgi:hypothetical protein
MTRRTLRTVFVLILLLFGSPLVSWAQNIITFGANPNTCGGAVICSTNGTTGYLINGTGEAFDLSTINSWFQIDTNGVNQLTSTQTEAEPDMGAGGFRVVNNTGSAVTSFSLTLTDTFTSSTSSVTNCGGSSGPMCDKFTAHGGSGTYSVNTELSGVDWFSCTQGTTVGMTCTGGSGGVAAKFTSGTVTYSWVVTGGGIPAGAVFDISFSSWNNNGLTVIPEPNSALLFGTGLLVFACPLSLKWRSGVFCW